MASKTTKSPKAAATKAKAAVTSPIIPLAPEELHKLIRQRAYDLFLQRGNGLSDPVQDWLLAEQEILGAFCRPAPEPVVEKASAKVNRAARPRSTATSTAKRSTTTTAATRTRRKSAPDTPKG